MRGEAASRRPTAPEGASAKEEFAASLLGGLPRTSDIFELCQVTHDLLGLRRRLPGLVSRRRIDADRQLERLDDPLEFLRGGPLHRYLLSAALPGVDCFRRETVSITAALPLS